MLWFSVFKAVVCVFFVMGVPWFVVFCAPGFVLLALQFGLQNCWPSEFLLYSCAPNCVFSASLLCFSVLPLLHVLHSRRRKRERVRVKEDTGGDKRRWGEGEGERGREQTREIGEIGRGRETKRGKGQGRDREGREREVVKGLRGTTGFHSLQTGGLDLTN